MAQSWYIPAGKRMRRTVVGDRPSMSTGPRTFGFNARIVGTRNVIRAFQYRVGQIQGATIAGMEMAAEYLHNNMETIPPLVPVSNDIKDEHLRDTWEVETMVTPVGGKITMGYTKEYAWYVHEMTHPPYGDVKWTRPGSGPHWFMESLQRDRPAMLDIIAVNAEKAV
jgi:hypothetical protein